jgi:hypothetical protein
MRFTGPRNDTQFTSLFFAVISFETTEYLLNLLAMKTCQINVPEGLTKMTCQNNLPRQLAEFKCDSNPQVLLARNKHDCSSRY